MIMRGDGGCGRTGTAGGRTEIGVAGRGTAVDDEACADGGAALGEDVAADGTLGGTTTGGGTMDGRGGG